MKYSCDNNTIIKLKMSSMQFKKVNKANSFSLNYDNHNKSILLVIKTFPGIDQEI